MSFSLRRPAGLTIVPPSPTTNSFSSSTRQQPSPALNNNGGGGGNNDAGPSYTNQHSQQSQQQQQVQDNQLLTPGAVYASPNPLSPRRNPLPPSPTTSASGYSTGGGGGGRAGRRGSADTDTHLSSISQPSDISSSYGYAYGYGNRAGRRESYDQDKDKDKDKDKDQEELENEAYDRRRRRSTKVKDAVAAAVEKRLPGLPRLSASSGKSGKVKGDVTGVSAGAGLEHEQGGVGGGRGGWAGAYDNRLVSSTLSHLPPLPPLPPLSPTPTGSSNPSSSMSHANPPIHQRLNSHRTPDLGNHSHSSHTYPHPHATPLPVPSRTYSASSGYAASTHSQYPSKSKSMYASYGAHSHNTSNTGLVVLPDGTALSTSPETATKVSDGRSMLETVVHSSPSSPWSVLTVHVLPLFAGGSIKTPMEDLNQLCNSHIVATSQRVPPARILAVLSSDLRDFIASGMSTLKAKFDTVEEAKVVMRAAEVWSFFWAQVLPYLEGVFLPLTQIKDRPSSTTSSPISVRHLVLSGFLIHILLPLLPRLIPVIALADRPVATPGHLSPNPMNNSNIHIHSNSNSNSNQASGTSSILHSPTLQPSPLPTPSLPDLQRLLQTSLVISTQARYSTFFAARNIDELTRRDEEIRENVEALGKAARWRIGVIQRNANNGNNIDPGYDIATGTGTGTGTRAGTGNPTEMSANLGYIQDGTPSAPKRHSSQRGPPLSQSGRARRRGWRASARMSQIFDGEGSGPSALGPVGAGASAGAGLSARGGMGASARRDSDTGAAGGAGVGGAGAGGGGGPGWGYDRRGGGGGHGDSEYDDDDIRGGNGEDDEDDDDSTTPGQSFAPAQPQQGQGQGKGKGADGGPDTRNYNHNYNYGRTISGLPSFSTASLTYNEPYSGMPSRNSSMLHSRSNSIYGNGNGTIASSSGVSSSTFTATPTTTEHPYALGHGQTQTQTQTQGNTRGVAPPSMMALGAPIASSGGPAQGGIVPDVDRRSNNISNDVGRIGATPKRQGSEVSMSVRVGEPLGLDDGEATPMGNNTVRGR